MLAGSGSKRLLGTCSVNRLRTAGSIAVDVLECSTDAAAAGWAGHVAHPSPPDFGVHV